MIKCTLNELLSRRNLSLEELSCLADVEISVITALCNGTAKHITIETLDRICEALQCQPCDILVRFNE